MPKRRLFVFVLALCIAAMVILACGESSNNTGTASNSGNSGNSGSSSSSSSAPTKAPANQHFKVGQQVKVGTTWMVTVDSTNTSTGSPYNTPKAGNVYLIVTVSLKNMSSQEQNVSSIMQFNLQDSSGQKYTETIDPDAGATLDGKVEAGSPLKGVIVYEVPKSMHSYQLSFQADITSEGQTLWDLSI